MSARSEMLLGIMANIKTYARPTWLYRYRSVGSHPSASTSEGKKLRRETEALLEGYVYCASYDQMNDPMEGLYRSSKKASEHPEYDTFVQQLRDEKLGLGIASFSETWDNELMWAHYADSFHGICICYSMQALLEGLGKQHAFSRVAYGNKPYYLNLPGLESDHERARAVLSTKHLSWFYEREWRLFSPIQGKAFHGVNAIKSVYLGSRMSKAMRASIKSILEPLDISIHLTEPDGYTVIRKNARQQST